MTCDHGYEHPHCPKVGCEASRPAVRLEDWIRGEGTTREPSTDLPAMRAPVAPLSEEERRERDRAGRELQRNLDELARRDNASGDMTRGRGFIGVQEDGRKADGAATWNWRPPVYCAPDPDPEGRNLDPVMMNGKVRYQPAPPVHVKGAAPGNAKDMARHVRRLSETGAQREIARRELAAAGIGASGMNPAQLQRAKIGRTHRGAR